MLQDSSLPLQTAAAGQGIAPIRPTPTFNELLTGRVIRLFKTTIPCPWNYYFVCPYSVLQAPKMQAFRTWLLPEVVALKLKLAGPMNDNAVCPGYVFKG